MEPHFDFHLSDLEIALVFSRQDYTGFPPATLSEKTWGDTDIQLYLGEFSSCTYTKDELSLLSAYRLQWQILWACFLAQTSPLYSLHHRPVGEAEGASLKFNISRYHYAYFPLLIIFHTDTISLLHWEAMITTVKCRFVTELAVY